MKKANGFATVLFLAFLPIVIAGGLASFFGFAILRADLAAMNACRAAQLQTQDQAGRDLEKLLAMNPRALKLRADEQVAQIRLASATASGNPYAIAAAEARLLYVQSQRFALAFRQKILIQSANMKFMMSTPRISQDVLAAWNHEMRWMGPWLTARLLIGAPRIPKLAVRPDFPDSAPAYQRVEGFEMAQSWSHTWQLQLEGNSWTKNFLKFRARFQRGCMTSLYADGGGWVGKLKADKSLSKPVSF